MIYTVIPVFNRWHFTKACVESLMRQTYTQHTVIVVDHGSTDGTSDYLKKDFPEVIVVKGDNNMWWTQATNAGVQKALELSAADNDCILTLNNDLVVQPDYLEALLAAAAKHPNAIIGSVSVNIKAPDAVHFAGTRWNSRTARYRPGLSMPLSYTKLKNTQDILPTDLLPGRGVLVPVAAYKEIGLYDEQYFPHYMADEDFSLRAKKAGYQLIIATGAVVYSHISDTGLNNRKKNWKYYKDVFTSIKSPANSRYRWHWAKRHAGIYPPVYFTMDIARIVKSLLIK